MKIIHYPYPLTKVTILHGVERRGTYLYIYQPNRTHTHILYVPQNSCFNVTYYLATQSYQILLNHSKSLIGFAYRAIFKKIYTEFIIGRKYKITSKSSALVDLFEVYDYPPCLYMANAWLMEIHPMRTLL